MASGSEKLLEMAQNTIQDTLQDRDIGLLKVSNGETDNIVTIKEETQEVEDIDCKNPGGSGDDILSLIKPGGPKPNYSLAQGAIRKILSKVPDRLLIIRGAPGTEKTWTYISLFSELLHENNFKVIISAPTHQVLDEVVVSLQRIFQQHLSLRNKVICRVKSKDLMNRNRRTTCSQMIEAIRMAAKQRSAAESDSEILEYTAFNIRMVEVLIKNTPKREDMEDLEARFHKRAATTDEEREYLNRVLNRARVDTLREIDIALITCDSASNKFFCQNFMADFVAVEDGQLEPIAASTLSMLNENFHPKLTIIVKTLRADGDPENTTDGSVADDPTDLLIDPSDI